MIIKSTQISDIFQIEIYIQCSDKYPIFFINPFDHEVVKVKMALFCKSYGILLEGKLTSGNK